MNKFIRLAKSRIDSQGESLQGIVLQSKSFNYFYTYKKFISQENFLKELSKKFVI